MITTHMQATMNWKTCVNYYYSVPLMNFNDRLKKMALEPAL